MELLINCLECAAVCARDVYHLKSACPLRPRTISECDNKFQFQCWNCPSIVTHQNFYCQGCGRKVYPFCKICKTMNSHPIGFCNLDSLDTGANTIKSITEIVNNNSQKTSANPTVLPDSESAKSARAVLPDSESAKSARAVLPEGQCHKVVSLESPSHPVVSPEDQCHKVVSLESPSHPVVSPESQHQKVVSWSQVVVKPDDIDKLPKIPIPPQFGNTKLHSSNNSPTKVDSLCNCIFCQRITGKAKLLEKVNAYNCNWCNNEFFHDKHNCPKYVKKSNNASCIFCLQEYGSKNGHRQGTNCPAYRDLVFCHNCNGKKNHCTMRCIKRSYDTK